MPWRPEAWSGLAAAKPTGFASLLTANEIIRWRDRTLLWYENHCHDAIAEPVHITLADTHTFIDQAVTEIAGLFVDLEAPLQMQN